MAASSSNRRSVEGDARTEGSVVSRGYPAGREARQLSGRGGGRPAETLVVTGVTWRGRVWSQRLVTADEEETHPAVVDPILSLDQLPQLAATRIGRALPEGDRAVARRAIGPVIALPRVLDRERVLAVREDHRNERPVAKHVHGDDSGCRWRQMAFVQEDLAGAIPVHVDDGEGYTPRAAVGWRPFDVDRPVVPQIDRERPLPGIGTVA